MGTEYNAHTATAELSFNSVAVGYEIAWHGWRKAKTSVHGQVGFVGAAGTRARMVAIWKLARTDACDDMSAISRSTCEDPDSRRISSSAAFPFSAFRQTMTTRAPILARPSAVSFPIPLFAPVTIHILPLILAGGITYDLSNVLI
jgi:hypothetical protein